ncbi:GGDEF domain-containing protein [Mycolicibacterium bacteremicum]|uniref:GGDEF domain-containing protein n=1 Tax=Mycolicibacterium bacteremicum TaxID=564198 RepID=UPI0026F34394|nr:GGDEF domain-containing protein [Mycolicibacterium bacteremicum]
MPSRVDLLPTATRWHLGGAAAYLAMLALYAGAATAHADGSALHRLYVALGAAALAVGAVLCVGRRAGWNNRRGLLFGWPVAALLTTVAAGLIEPAATRDLPGTITITFAYAGLTNPPRRSLLLLPIGVAAFVIGGELAMPASWPAVVMAAVMWALIAEVPAWLVSRLQEQSRQLRAIAQTDALTQLFDRHTLAPQLAAYGGESAVVLIDLDGFKLYNDRHGHQAGDDVLVSFADTLRWSTRSKDIVFRIGGDEFLVILVGVDEAEAQRVVERIRKRWTASGGPVTFSAGIASGEGDLVKLSDEQMYRDKRLRRTQ